MRKRFGLLVLVAVAASARVTQGQATSTAVGSTAIKDSVAIPAVPTAQPTADEALKNLQKAAEELSRAIEATVAKAASNPELKTAALQVAAGAVNVAQQSLAEQLKMIESALNAAARQIAAAQAANAAKAAGSQAPTK